MSGSQKRIAALSRKEFLHIVKDPRTLLIVFMLPLIQLVLFGYSFKMEVGEITLAVIDDSGSPASRKLIERFAGSELFRVVPFTGDRADTELIFKRRAADALLVIPRDFDRRLERGESPDVQVVIDASDPNTAVLVRTYVSRLIAGFAAAARPPVQFETRTSILYNPDLKSSFFFVPGIVAMIMVMICALLTSITVARERETGTMEQILVSPIRPREIIAGKVLPYVLLAFIKSSLVNQWEWITRTQLLDAVAIGQVTPGPLFTTATFIGFLLAGVTGAAAATAGIFLPSFIFVAISGPIIPRLRNSALAGAFLDGVNAASLALMAVVTLQLGADSLRDPLSIILALASAVLLLRFKLNSTWLILSGAIIGLIAAAI